MGFCEIDKYASAAYKAMYDTEKEAYYSDITKIDTAGMPDFDLLTGGFPCQSYSVCGYGRALTIPEELCFLNLPESSKKSDLQLFCLKMFPASYLMTASGHFKPSSVRFRNWGTVLNGWCITAPVLESHSQENGCTLSDIAVPNAPEEYFLSIAAQKKLQRNSSEECRGKESMT